MSNVIPFKQKAAKPRLAVVGGTDSSVPACAQEDHKPTEIRQEEAGVLVMRALEFYARQGYDGGAFARKAVIAVQRELNDQPSQA